MVTGDSYTLVKLYKNLLRLSTKSKTQTSKKKKNDERHVLQVLIIKIIHTFVQSEIVSEKSFVYYSLLPTHNLWHSYALELTEPVISGIQ